MINYDSERGISVTTTPGRKTHSQLFIQRADVSDSGNYTCAPSSSLAASIQVFVSGEEGQVREEREGDEGRSISLASSSLTTNLAKIPTDRSSFLNTMIKSQSNTSSRGFSCCWGGIRTLGS